MTELELWKARANAALEVIRAAKTLTGNHRPYSILDERGKLTVRMQDYMDLVESMDAYERAARAEGEGYTN